MKFKDIFLNFFGAFYIIIALLAFYDSITYFGFPSILWISYLAFLFIGIGILTRNSYLIGSQLNIVFIPYLIWCIDFFYILITSKSLWGIADFLFATEYLLPKIVTIQHLIIIPIMLISLYFIKFKRKDFWKFSLVQITIVYLLTIIFSESSKNINWVFRNNLDFEFGEFYPLVWFGAYIFMIILVNFCITRIKSFISIPKRKLKKFK